jgi:hypothetical protein
MLDSFLAELVMRRTTAWFEQRNPFGPKLMGIRPVPLLGGNWFVHLVVSNERPVMHALVRIRGMSFEGIDIVQADATICPACQPVHEG